MIPKLVSFLQSKGLSKEDIKTVDTLIEEERREDYTVGYDILNVKELNPFYSTDEAIELLDRLGADSWCWDNCSERLDELWKEDNAPQAYIEGVTTIFSRILGDELSALYLLYDKGFFEYFEDDYKHDSFFLDCLYSSVNSDTIVERVESACIKYIKEQHSNQFKKINAIDVLTEILDFAIESNPMLLTSNLISQINKFYSAHLEVSNIELVKLWGKYEIN